MAGHSKWAKVKHFKGAIDAKRGKIFAKLGREITIATKPLGVMPVGRWVFPDDAVLGEERGASAGPIWVLGSSTRSPTCCRARTTARS